VCKIEIEIPEVDITKDTILGIDVGIKSLRCGQDRKPFISIVYAREDEVSLEIFITKEEI
jgi:hypothetical protein